MADTAIVILNYNGSSYLKKFLPGIIQNSQNCDIWVVDNASSDDSLATIDKNFPEVKVLVFEKNYGFCGGYNRALRQIETPYIILLNSDIEVTENWVSPLTEKLKHNSGTAAVQPKVRSFHNREFFEYAGAAGGMLDRYGYPFCRGRIFDCMEKDEGQYDEELEVFWATGACMAVKRDVFNAIGGFDEYFFAHMEEIDLCWRLKNQGYIIKYCPESTIYHVGGGTLAKEDPRKAYLNFRNSLLVLLKNLPAHQLVPKIFVRLVLDFPAALSFIIKGKVMSAFMILKAHVSFYFVALRHINNRKPVKINPKYMPGFYNKSIVFKYFVTGVRKTTDL